MMHTQEADGGRGIPHLLHGLYPTIDDLAKLTTLLQNGGQHQGQQLLSAAKLAKALYKTDAMGLPTGRKNRFGEGRYHLSFWSVPYRTANGCFFQIPYMAGYGGNLVVLLPNGISAFRFADGKTATWTQWCWQARLSAPSVRQGLVTSRCRRAAPATHGE